MDASNDPCEDFYSFACGNWMKKFSKDDNYSVIDGMGNTLLLTIKDLLENSKDSVGSSEKLKTMYDSCMEERSSEWNAISSVINFLDQSGIHKWPNPPENSEMEASSLTSILSNLAAHNEFAFLNFKPSHYEPKDAPSYDDLLKLTAYPSYPLMHDESESEIFENMILHILKLFGVNAEDANRTWIEFKTIDTSVLRLHRETSETITYDEEGSEPLGYANCSSNATDSKDQLCSLLDKFIEFINADNRYSRRIVYIERLHYIQNVFPVIANFTHKSLTNYLALRLVVSHLSDLSSPFRALRSNHRDMDSSNNDQEIPIPNKKWQICSSWISRYMSYPLGQQYVRKVLPESHMEDISYIVHTFINDAAFYVLKQRWMKKSLRRKLKLSIDDIRNSLEHYVYTLRNGTKLGAYMNDFHPKHESFLKNVMDYRRLTFRFYLLNYSDLEGEDFPAEPFIVNAYHSPGVLDFRFGIFLPPVYQYGRPKLLNFATMGTTIGHELGHEIEAFMDDPENFDNETLHIYNEKKKCLQDQYFNFEVEKIGKKVKGNQTIHENLADLMGIEITQQIITRFLLRNNESRFTLPALDFSTEQILYIALAQMWCSVRSKQKEQLHYDQDIHAPSNIRIAGMLRNLREFSEAFNCPSGSFMNPVEKCSFRHRS
ncbi:Endothelin-converting enzyme 1 like protein [Argiope bruennichi]|uniref:Endothelin-converting enzyme 1 like protein n=1 Tax=Argiope bruennichi TaxID=94029 RepID=A0A8T0G0R7_ARGBR|nr:Endothelin-converting enzyme 1 like protein [Argiope bruennichi]